MIKLVAFDGDNTLWTPLSGVNLSDRTPTDDIGNPNFTYKASLEEPLQVEREDGALFALRTEVLDVMEELRERGTLIGVVSYNHEGNVRRILEAFTMTQWVRYVVAEWHTDKDKMLAKMRDMAQADGYNLAPSEMLLVDDDPEEIYGAQCSAMGVLFTRFGVETHNLWDVMVMLDDAPLDDTVGR